MKKLFVRCSLLLIAASASFAAQAGCYTVYDKRGKVLSESPNPPVDMSYQLHQTVPYKYGKGSVMVHGLSDGNCGKEVDTYYDTPKERAKWAAAKAKKSKKTRRKVRRTKKSS